MIYLLIYLCGAGAFYLFVTSRKPIQKMLDDVDEHTDYGRAIGLTVVFSLSLLWPLMAPGLLVRIVRRQI